MQLLTVGKSLRNIENKPNHYRMSTQRFLPIFGSSKRNVFAARPEESQAASDKAPKEMDRIPDGSGASAGQAHSTKRWWPFGRKIAKNRPAPLSAQAQLELHAVKPIRNDLIDTDLEIVIRPRMQAQNPFSASRAGKQKGPGWWSRILGRVLRRQA